jgi:putative nucleotidyltransferase with HDIG domain
LAQAAGECGAATYAVGGYVRDRLLGVSTTDVDVLIVGALRETAEYVAARLYVRLVMLREQQPTIRLVFPDRSHIDLTQPRVTPPAPAAPPTRADLEADLRGRDFTVNALAVPVEALIRGHWQRQVIDPTSGLGDLERRVLRATSRAIWSDDPLRLWRALRLAAQLGFGLEPKTEASLRAHAALSAQAAPERIRDELFALLARADADAWLSRAADLGLLFAVMPELAPLQGLPQGGYHHLDGWQHTLAVVAQVHALAQQAPGMTEAHQAKLRQLFARSLAGGSPVGAAPYGAHKHGARQRLALLKLAALLHDVGKPSTRAVDDESRVHFYGHEKVSAATAREVARRLRLGRREVCSLEVAAGLHMHPALLAQQEISRRAAHRFFRKAGNHAPDILLLAWADRLSARGPAARPEHFERVERAVRWLLGEWLEQGQLAHPQPPVGARAIMRRYGLEPGPQVGRVLRALTRRQAEEPFPDADAAWAFLERMVRRPTKGQAAPSAPSPTDQHEH